ncbi:MAG: hypothetical protein J6S85_19360 [Methanobrevibacter sp.]|nr:hypothetical protein [Methanobrevibacter sp.]
MYKVSQFTRYLLQEAIVPPVAGIYIKPIKQLTADTEYISSQNKHSRNSD